MTDSIYRKEIFAAITSRLDAGLITQMMRGEYVTVQYFDENNKIKTVQVGIKLVPVDEEEQ